MNAETDIVELANGLVIAHGPGDGFYGGSLALNSGGIISLPNANALVPAIVCTISGCDGPGETLNPGQLAFVSGGDATFNFITPVDVYAAFSGGSISISAFGNYVVNDQFDQPQTVENQIRIFNPVVADEFITLHASGDVVQMTGPASDVHLKAKGLIATSDNGNLYLDDGGNLGEDGPDPGNQVGGDINGYVMLNAAGDAYFTNTVDTILGGHAYFPIDPETGWQLSHGERSRIFLARALLQDAQLTVLDESFAALDPETLKLCLDCVFRRARTLVVIAHP